MRLFISGVSGIGKTTLAQRVSQEYDIPFIVGSTKMIWHKYGIKSHKEIISMCINQPKIGYQFQMEIIDYRLEMMQTHKEFVTDRSPVDNVVYMLTQMGHTLTEDEFYSYLEKAKIAYNNFEDVKHLHLAANYNTLNSLAIEDDNMRISSRYFQLTINSVFEMVIKGNWLDIRQKDLQYIDTWDWSTRMTAVQQLLTK